MTYQFKIQIKGITKPPVWRKVAVPADFTFHQLHNVIQIAFGWKDYHLYAFQDKMYQSSIRIALPSENDWDFGVETLDASKFKLSGLFSGNIRKFLYIYDFGDDWIHEITLEAVTDEKRSDAFCISGKGACPPEDCGGCYGYENIKRIFQTSPRGEEAAGYRQWLGLDKGKTWDANAFDLEEVNENLKRV